MHSFVVFAFFCVFSASSQSLCDKHEPSRPSLITKSGNLVISGGKNEGNVEITTCGSATILFNGKPLQSIKGERGEKGDRGAQGRNGSDGQIGPVGAKGEKGDDGKVGPTGPKGNTGIQGIQGAIGLKGNAGNKGDRGQQGPKGSAGTKGQKGEQGIGIKGTKGETGTTGLQGPPGGTQKLNTTVEYLYNEVIKLQQLTTSLLDCNARGLLYDSQNRTCKEPAVFAYALKYPSTCAEVPRKDSDIYSIDRNGLVIRIYCDMTIKKSLGGNGRDQTSAAASCSILKTHFNAKLNGRYWIDPDADAEDTSNAALTYCLMTSQTPIALPSSLVDDSRLVNFYVFSTTTPNFDIRNKKNLTIASKYYAAKQGLDVNGIAGNGATFSYSDQTIVMLAARNFGLSGTSGMIFQTSTGDDGLTIRNDFFGGRTHTSAFDLRGTKLSNVLPKQGVVAPFGFHLRSDGVEFWTETTYYSPTSSTGGPYDNLIKDRFVLGSNFDSWTSGSFVVKAFLNYNAKLSTADVQKVLKTIKSL